MKKNKITIFLAAMVSLSCAFSACTEETGNAKMDISGVTVPTFEETEGVVFTAYSGPTVENWNGVSRNVSTITDEHFQKFVDAGFNKIIAIHEGAIFGKAGNVFDTIKMHSVYAEEDAMEVLALAEKYGVDYYVRDWSFYDLHNGDYWDALDTYEKYEQVITEMFSEDNPYIYSSSYAGNFGRDEPGADQFERLGWQIDIYNKCMEERGVEGEFLLNLLPAYTSNASYGGERGEPVTYIEYVDRYFEELAPKLGYVSYDFYPFLQYNVTDSLLRTNHLSNLEIMASRCRDNDIDLRTFVQTGADFTGLRDMTSIGDFRLQVYSNMAFGAKEMTYYEYGTFNSQEEGEFGLINLQDGTYNYTYDMVKTVNNEVHAFEDAYLNFDWQGIMCFSSKSASQINLAFRNVSNKLESHDRIAEVKLTQDAIIGTFTDDKGQDAFMLVNYNDPFYDLDNEVTIKFNDAKGLLMYRFGQKHVVPLNEDGTYTFKLYPGEGRFIIPIK